MKSINLFSVSEARAQFWKILRLVSAGEDVVIINRRKKQKFQITRFEKNPQKRQRAEIIHDPV